MNRAALRHAGVALALVVLAGCAGPHRPLHFGGKAVPVNVAFGGPAKGDPRLGGGPFVDVPAPSGLGVVPTPVAAVNVLPAVVPVATVPGTPTTTRPATPPDPCPARDPLAFPLSDADNQVRVDAPKGTFRYRVTGTATGADGRGPFDEVVTHEVAPAGTSGDGTRTFTDTATAGASKVVTTYKARPSEGLGVGATGTEVGTGEVELSSVVATTTAGSAASFAPSGSGLRLLQLRAADGVSWSDVSNDPLSQSTLTIDARIIGRGVVDACGQPVSAWQVAGTQTIVTPSENVTSTVNRWVATQYGGLVVKEEVSYSGTKNGVAIQGRRLTTIMRDPGR
jgi:hypothetical protein